MDEIKDFLSRYKYRKDIDGDRWTLLDGIGETRGDIHGDCEDFAYTVLWLMAGRSWLKFWWLVVSCQAVLWFVKTQYGEGHAVLWMRGHGWIDCNHREWSATPHYKKVFPYIAPSLALVLAVK